MTLITISERKEYLQLVKGFLSREFDKSYKEIVDDFENRKFLEQFNE